MTTSYSQETLQDGTGMWGYLNRSSRGKEDPGPPKHSTQSLLSRLSVKGSSRARGAVWTEVVFSFTPSLDLLLFSQKFCVHPMGWVLQPSERTTSTPFQKRRGVSTSTRVRSFPVGSGVSNSSPCACGMSILSAEPSLWTHSCFKNLSVMVGGAHL